jgi:hypothetical protein
MGGEPQSVPADGTLVVDRAGSGSSQVHHRAVNPQQPPSDKTFRFASNGILVAEEIDRETMHGQTVAFTCTFAPPLAALPWPPTAGTNFTGNGDCNGSSLRITGTVTGTRTVSVAGKDVVCYVIEDHLVGHGQVELTGTIVEWVAPSVSLPVHEETRMQGTYSGLIRFNKNTVADLVSLQP